MSGEALADLLDILQPLKQPLVCPASGDSPAGLYRALIRRNTETRLPVSDWSFVGLDEWAGMNEKDPGSCRNHLNNDLFQPLNVQEDKICFFNGRASDLDQECQRIEQFIDGHGGIDLTILGLGMNGHVGMNEPFTAAASRSHVTDIDQETQRVGQKYFTSPQSLEKGLTLGMATILSSRHIFLVVSGQKKAAIVKKILQEEISEALPASLLRRHQQVTLYLDADAAKLIGP